MLKRSMLKRGSDSLSDQIYQLFKTAIHEGRLEPGVKLPSTRQISEQLGVSRPTVFVSIEQLTNEGYVDVRPGSGMYVGEHVDFKRFKSDHELQPSLSRYAQVLQSMQPVESTFSADDREIAFYPWRPAFDQFPKTEWGRQLGREGRNLDLVEMDLTSEPQGSRSLRKQIERFYIRFLFPDNSEDALRGVCKFCF